MNKISRHDLAQAEHYDKIAQQRLNSRSDKKAPYPAAVKEINEFLDFVGLKKKSNILEIGCGTGGITLRLLRQGHKVLGTEISQKSLDVLKEFARREGLARNLSTRKTDFVSEEIVKKYKNKFDLALFIGTIHHLDPRNREKIFTNAVRTVKEGGLVVAFETNPLNPFYYPWYLWREIRNTQGVSRWKTETGMLATNIWNLKRLYRQAGLSQIEVERDALLPNRFGNRFPLILSINDFLLKIPIIKEMSAFIWIKGRKM